MRRWLGWWCAARWHDTGGGQPQLLQAILRGEELCTVRMHHAVLRLPLPLRCTVAAAGRVAPCRHPLPRHPPAPNDLVERE